MQHIFQAKLDKNYIGEFLNPNTFVVKETSDCNQFITKFSEIFPNIIFVESEPNVRYFFYIKTFANYEPEHNLESYISHEIPETCSPDQVLLIKQVSEISAQYIFDYHLSEEQKQLPKLELEELINQTIKEQNYSIDIHWKGSPRKSNRPMFYINVFEKINLVDEPTERDNEIQQVFIEEQERDNIDFDESRFLKGIFKDQGYQII